PGFWGIGVLLLVAFLLQVTATTSRGGDAEGSLSFVIHLAAGVLFGPFWGGIVAGLSTVLSQIPLRRPLVKAAFNIAQRVVAVVAGITVYTSLGGTVPPTFLLPGAHVDPGQAVLTALAFLAGSATYFLVNSLAVSAAVALSTRRPFG